MDWVLLVGLLIIAAAIYFGFKWRKNTFSKERLMAQLKSDPKFMDGIKRGVADCKAGRIRDWKEIKKELGIKD